MEHITIEECCDILDSRRIPITASERRNGRYPYYGANGIQDYVADYIFDDELVLLAEDGGNFGSKTRPIAYRVSGKCWVNNHAHVLKPMANVDVDFHIEPQLQTDYASIQVIGRDTILCCVHLNSQIYSDHVSRREIVIEQIINDILKLENGLNTTNTIIVGDFNINPYDNSCVNARYFHGIPIYEDAMRESRNIAGKEFRMFYNPMWNFLGDFQKPYGTYYYNGGGAKNTYWNIFDQVLFRPILKKRFLKDSLKILTETETKYLLDSNGHPDQNISDHLPIIFEITEEVSHG